VGWRLDSLPFFDRTAIVKDKDGKVIYQGTDNPNTGGAGVLMEDGSSMEVQMELGGDISIAGKKAASLVDVAQIFRKLIDVGDENTYTEGGTQFDTGYIRFENGLLIQWGREYKTGSYPFGARDNSQVTLPYSYKNNRYAVSINSLRDKWGEHGHDYVFNQTTGSFNATHEAGNGFGWIAIGYANV
jgi:hypothetical protein